MKWNIKTQMKNKFWNGVLDLKTSFFFKYLLLRYKTPPKKKKGQKFPRQSKMLLFRKTQLLNHKPKLYEKTVHNFLIWYLLYLVHLCINWSRIKWIFHDLAKKKMYLFLCYLDNELQFYSIWSLQLEFMMGVLSS